MIRAHHLTKRFGDAAAVDDSMLNITNDPNMLHPWTGGAVATHWGVAALGSAACLLRRRDA